MHPGTVRVAAGFRAPAAGGNALHDVRSHAHAAILRPSPNNLQATAGWSRSATTLSSGSMAWSGPQPPAAAVLWALSTPARGRSCQAPARQPLMPGPHPRPSRSLVPGQRWSLRRAATCLSGWHPILWPLRQVGESSPAEPQEHTAWPCILEVGQRKRGEGQVGGNKETCAVAGLCPLLPQGATAAAAAQAAQTGTPTAKRKAAATPALTAAWTKRCPPSQAKVAAAAAAPTTLPRSG